MAGTPVALQRNLQTGLGDPFRQFAQKGPICLLELWHSPQWGFADAERTPQFAVGSALSGPASTR